MNNLYDADQVRRSLATLHGGSKGLLNVVSTGNWPGSTFSTDPNGIDAATSYVTQLDRQGKQGIYVRVTTLREPPPAGRRGDAELSLALPGFWTDLDIDGPGHKTTGILPPDEAAARRIMAESGLPEPTLWQHSGGGLYTWHMFDEPYLISSDTLPAISGLSERFQQVVKASADRLGYEYGPVGDLPRVLRIPGTVNRKAGLERPCTIVEASGIAYPLGELTPLIYGIQLPQPPAVSPPSQALPFTQPRAFRDDDELSPGDDYNERATWEEILIGRLRWTCLGRFGGEVRWLHPNATSDLSATTGRNDGDNLWVFSTNTEFEPQRVYDKFGAYTLITQGSTSAAAFSAAAKELRSQGYGSRAERDDFRDLVAPAVDGNTALAIVHQLRPENATKNTPQHRGHLRMAERFVTEHSNTLRHVHGIGWHRWDGARWAADDQRADIQAAVATAKNALEEVAALPAGQERDDLYKDARKTENASGTEGMLKFAAALPPISTASKALDADPYLFNTPGGTLNLKTGTIKANDRADLITKAAGAAFANEGSPEWDAFLVRILPDPEVRAFLQRLIGYAMLGKVTEHVMLIFTGMGANGKGTTRDALMAAFGDYAIEIDPAMLMESKHERHGAFKMRLRGARLVFCSETEKGRRFAEATMKRLVGGDPIEANLMHKNPITFDPSHTLIMLTNHLPAVSGDDPAVWRRLLVVPFDVVIPERERDTTLSDRLRDAAPAILAWAYQGWLDYQQQGLNPPEAVRKRTEAYQADSDALGRFLDERIITNPHSHVKARDLFAAWNQWCYDNGEMPTPEKAFADSMSQRGFAKKRGAAGVAYHGLMLAAPDDS
ncbi:phage/plasmid primase, P4 family [Nonomuraea sp. NPDC026600]|uniref:DNA primase family protein n=1 Tax=Nonomuraea sp. NPDC026600 TaxID=3155363 RepID=UPI0033F3DA79